MTELQKMQNAIYQKTHHFLAPFAFWEPDPKQERQTAEVEFDPKQRWPLERDLDRDTRKVCEAT